MSAMKGGINLCRIFFYRGNTMGPDTKRSLVALAYATARRQQLAPQAILIRSNIHDTTTFQGNHIKDPNGWHATIAFKDGTQAEQDLHVASHGYTDAKDNFTLKEAKSSNVKRDDTPRGGKSSGKVVWPSPEKLEEYEDSPIAYSHLPENE